MVFSILVACAAAMPANSPIQAGSAPKLGHYVAEIDARDLDDNIVKDTLMMFDVKKSSSPGVYSITGEYFPPQEKVKVTLSGTLYLKTNSIKGILKFPRYADGLPDKREWILNGDYRPRTKDFIILVGSREGKGTRNVARVTCRHIDDLREKPKAKAWTVEGSWRHDTESIGRSTWEVKDEGNNYFSAKEAGLGGVKATKVRWGGGTLRIEFDEPKGWAGFYEWKIPPGQNKGEGHLTITRGRVGTYKSTVSKG